jgi:proline racemase
MIRTIDAHAAGGAVRLVVDGFPSPRGRTMFEKRAWLARKAEPLRRALMLEPRGHADMCGAVLTEPVAPGSHAGVLFFHQAGYAAMSGHGIIGVTTIALERGLIMPGGDGATLVLDTPAGTIRAMARWAERAERGGGTGEAGRAGELGGAGRVDGVTFVNVPSFVLHAGLPVVVGPRKFRADVAYSGAFYAIVDSEAVGLPIDAAHLPELRRAGVAIVRAIEEIHTIAHPLDQEIHHLDGTIFTAPPSDDVAALKTVTISAQGQAGRSPGGTASGAVMAVLDAMGLVSEDMPFALESVIGTHFTGRISGRTTVGDYPAIVPEIAGAAWITGEHTFFMDEDDPLKEGFRV